MAVTLLATFSVAPTLRALDAAFVAAESGATPSPEGISPRALLRIHALPARIAVSLLIVSLGFSALTLLPALRPATNDLYRQTSLVVLYGTIVAASGLPLYVRLRKTISHVLELAPERAADDAIVLLEASRRGAVRLQTRFLVAVAAPVAFVALGASLVVFAHARAEETAARSRTAIDLARGTLGPTAEDERGRPEAVAQLAPFGYQVDVAEPSGLLRVVPDASRFDSFSVVFPLLSIVGILIAAILGRYIGTHFSADISLVTHSVRSTGVADVIRGTRMVRLARFISVGKLMSSIEALGDIFREFAAVQAKAIQASEATERMRGLFLASMSHDLKAPLNAILGFAALASRARLSDGQRESLTIIEQRGRELLYLIQTILDAARVEAGALVLTPELTSVEDVVMGAVLEARDLGAGGGRVRVVGEVQPGMPRHRLDSLRMVQALAGVIMSAARFAEEDGTVLVQATFRADLLRIDVETSGLGLPEVERAKLFEAFKDPDKARHHGALGLGLSLARSIVELHDGSIDVVTEEARMVFMITLSVPHTGMFPPSVRSK